MAKGRALLLPEQYVCRLEVTMHAVALVEVATARSNICQQGQHMRLQKPTSDDIQQHTEKTQQHGIDNSIIGGTRLQMADLTSK